MKSRIVILIVSAMLVFIAIACEKKDTQPVETVPVVETVQPAEQPLVAELDPAENLGQKIGSSYIETLKQVVAMLKDRHPVEEARGMLGDMKNWTIELMVDLGREREAMSEEDRAVVDRILSERITSIPADLFREYQEGQIFYKEDSDLFKLIADFNIITQYANFDLLKKQLPDEAVRLGIE